MQTKRDQLVLGLAFVAAIVLHAVALPWVGAAVGQSEPGPQFDTVVHAFEVPGFLQAGAQIELGEDEVHEYQDGVLLDRPRHDRRDELLLSRDRSADERDHVLFSKDVHGSAPGDDYIPDARLIDWPNLPADADGPYWLIYQADVDEQAPDIDRSNNTRSAPIFIDGPQRPELAIDRFDTPTQALPGGAITIDYEVHNVGKGWANTQTDETQLIAANWIDRVYLSEDDRLDDGDLPLRTFERIAPLGPDDSYRHERVGLSIPPGIVGKYHLILAADADQQLDQPAFTQGLVAKPIELIDTSAPDLVVAQILDADRLVIDRPTPITFSIANLGNATTQGDWMDGVYLSPEPVLDSRAIPLGRINAGTALDPRKQYDTDLPITVPSAVEPGQWYLVVKADASNAIDEPGFEDNNTMAVPVTVLTQKQADAEIQLGSPERPERLVVQWIEHERLEEHRARLSRTVQPALQDKADPLKDAPLNFEPQPPSIARQPGNPAGDPAQANRQEQPTENQDARPQPNAPAPAETNQAPKPQDPGTQANTRIDGLTGTDGSAPQQRPGIDRPLPPTLPTPNDPTPGDKAKPSPLPGEEKIEAPANPDAPNTDSNTDSKTLSKIETESDGTNPEKSPATEPSEQLTPAEVQKPSENDKAKEPTEADGQGDSDTKATEQSTTPKPSEDAEPKPDGKPDQPSEASEQKVPTRVPRKEAEAPPTTNRKIEVKLQEGKVLVGKGIEVTTKLPTRPGTGAARLSLPRNARVSVTFNKKGEVFEAKVLRSTTYKEWDAAIEASLYRWSARGEAVDAAEPYITIEWDYILNELLGDED